MRDRRDPWQKRRVPGICKIQIQQLRHGHFRWDSRQRAIHTYYCRRRLLTFGYIYKHVYGKRKTHVGRVLWRDKQTDTEDKHKIQKDTGDSHENRIPAGSDIQLRPIQRYDKPGGMARKHPDMQLPENIRQRHDLFRNIQPVFQYWKPLHLQCGEITRTRAYIYK